MIIRGELCNIHSSIPVSSEWLHSSDDPWAVEVEFLGHESTWIFYLELLMEAATSPSGGLHGFGDVLIEFGEESVFIHLDNGHSSASLKFASEDIWTFLDQVDVRDSDEFVARELDEFLGAL